MTYSQIRIDLTIKTKSPLHISSGAASSGVYDKFMLFDDERKPYIPGSTVKGNIRNNYAQLVNDPNSVLCNNGRDICNCSVCQIFGCGGNSPSQLYFSNYKLEEQQLFEPQGRVNVALDRYRKTAHEGALLNYQAAWGDDGLLFLGNIEGRIPNENFERVTGNLYKAIKLIQALGFGKSRGLGWVEVSPKFFKKTNDSWEDISRQVEGWVLGNAI